MIFKGTKFALSICKFFLKWGVFFRIERLYMSCAIRREEGANNNSYILLNTTSNIGKNPFYFYYLFSDKMLKIWNCS